MACNLGDHARGVGEDDGGSSSAGTRRPASWATALIVGTYASVGGLAAVVYTDAIQCAVMIGGCLLVLVLGLGASAGSTGCTTPRTPPGSPPGRRGRRGPVGGAGPAPAPRYTDLILPVDTPTPFPWPAIYFGLALILSPAYWIGNQAIVQRSLGARSEFEAKASYIWGALLKNADPADRGRAGADRAGPVAGPGGRRHGLPAPGRAAAAGRPARPVRGGVPCGADVQHRLVPELGGDDRGARPLQTVHRPGARSGC